MCGGWFECRNGTRDPVFTTRRRRFLIIYAQQVLFVDALAVAGSQHRHIGVAGAQESNWQLLPGCSEISPGP